MASRSRPSAEKRRIEKQRQENRAAKLERRQTRAAEEGGEDGGRSEDELFEQFRLLNEGRAAGRVTDEDFEKARAEIMEALGVEI